MRRQWFWLEDQPETIADLRVEIGRHVEVEVLTTLAKLLRRLLDVHPDERDHVGLILDVMLTNTPMLSCPPSWHGQPTKQSIYWQTKLGYDAGLLFYEKFLLPSKEVPRPPFLPPPVVFLTVVNQDMRDFEPRLAAVRSAWASARGVKPEEALVKWARKWDADGRGLLAVLRQWGET